MNQPPTVGQLVEGTRRRDRRALARAITLVESTRADHRDEALAVIDALLPDTGNAIRIGVSGAPGVGKSTFIDALGVYLIEHGHQIAVLAVDPSSTRSGGSILGDKTRMSALANEPAAFIRPSPSGGTVGGVARRTREALLVCEAFGFDVVLVETVGVGQSDTAVDDLVDVFVLLVQPGGGDDLQGIKRGVMELADLVVVTKADGELAGAARRAAADYGHALQLIRPKHPIWRPRVLSVSAATRTGIAEVWDEIVSHQKVHGAAGAIDARRSEQARAWFWSEVTEHVLAGFRADPEVSPLIENLERAVIAGEVSPSAAAGDLLARYRRANTTTDH